MSDHVNCSSSLFEEVNKSCMFRLEVATGIPLIPEQSWTEGIHASQPHPQCLQEDQVEDQKYSKLTFDNKRAGGLIELSSTETFENYMGLLPNQ